MRIQKYSLQKIWIAENLKLGDPTYGYAIGGFAVRKSGALVISVGQRSIDATIELDHEFFHYMDGKDHPDGEDNDTWIKANKHGWEDYDYEGGSTAIASGENLDKAVPGFGRAYGKKGGAEEDQASIAEGILDKKTLREFIMRSKKDVVLKSIKGKYSKHFDGMYIFKV